MDNEYEVLAQLVFTFNGEHNLEEDKKVIAQMNDVLRKHGFDSNLEFYCKDGQGFIRMNDKWSEGFFKGETNAFFITKNDYYKDKVLFTMREFDYELYGIAYDTSMTIMVSESFNYNDSEIDNIIDFNKNAVGEKVEINFLNYVV